MAGQRGDRVDRIELDHPGAGAAQRVEQFARRVLRAVGVVDDVDRDAVAETIDQQAGEGLAAEADVLEDEVFQVDVVAGVLHRLEHRRQRLCAVAQQLRLVAGHQRAAGQRVLERVVAL